MDKITFSIVSRGELIINWDGKTIRVTGELTFEPSVFYADLASFEKTSEINNYERIRIIEFIKNDSLKSIGTQIFFD